MSAITDKGMQAKVTDRDQWLFQPFKRGSGVFVGRITPSGERLFYFRYSNSQGKRPFLPIGPYHSKGKDGLTLAEAYSQACAYADLYRRGVRDLHEHLEAQRADEIRLRESQRQQAIEEAQQKEMERLRKLTVKQLFDRWLSVELKSHQRTDGKRVGRKDNGAYVFAQFSRHVFPWIGDTFAAEVTKADVLAILDQLKSKGKLRTCNILLSDLKQMFRFAMAREIITANPLELVTKRDAGGADVERERFLSKEEIQALARQLPISKLGMRQQLALWIILGTGCRVGEVMSATWEAVNMRDATWHLAETKNQRAHTIHLSPFVIDKFQTLLTLRNLNDAGIPSPWVFPNSKNNGPVCVKSIGKQISDRQRTTTGRMSGRSKMTASLALSGGKWTAHDLRRTAGTSMARLGISADVIDECLNHMIQRRTTRIYIRDRREADQKRAFDALGTHLHELIVGSCADSNVQSIFNKTWKTAA